MHEDLLAVLEGRSNWCVITADALSTIAELPDLLADHVISDPPYDSHTHSNASTWTAATKHAVAIGIDFPPIVPETIVKSLLRVSRRWTLAFCAFEMLGEYINASGKGWVRTGVYRRTNGAPQFTGDRPAQAAEAIAILHNLKTKKRWNGGGGQAFWSSATEKVDRCHPTQKPINLMMQLVEQFTDLDELILDPFCGAGTTGVAALRQGRRFIGVELQEKYASKARERIRIAEQDYLEEVEQRRVFAAAMAEETAGLQELFSIAMGGD